MKTWRGDLWGFQVSFYLKKKSLHLLHRKRFITYTQFQKVFKNVDKIRKINETISVVNDELSQEIQTLNFSSRVYSRQDKSLWILYQPGRVFRVRHGRKWHNQFLSNQPLCGWLGRVEGQGKLALKLKRKIFGKGTLRQLSTKFFYQLPTFWHPLQLW